MPKELIGTDQEKKCKKDILDTGKGISTVEQFTKIEPKNGQELGVNEAVVLGWNT